MLWFLSIPILWFVGKRARWLHSLDAVLKNQRRMRVEMRLGDASHMSAFDGGELEALTHELQSLGFVHLGDLLSRMDTVPDTPADLPFAPIADPRPPQPEAPKLIAETTTDGMGRVFAHPAHGCYAILISAVAVSRFPPEMKRDDIVNVAPFQTVILTVSGTEEEAWSFSTHNLKVDPFGLLLRHPRRVGYRLLGAKAAQLLEQHLAQRDDIAARANCLWDKAPSLKKYQEIEARNLRHIRGVYERATTLGVAWHLLTFRLSKHEKWMGELAGR